MVCRFLESDSRSRKRLFFMAMRLTEPVSLLARELALDELLRPPLRSRDFRIEEAPPAASYRSTSISATCLSNREM
jgi:hypothetical protein